MMLEKFRKIFNGESEVPIEYIYYLIALNVFTIFVFLFAIYYTQKIMNQDDEDDHLSDNEILDENGNLIELDDSISGGTATTSSSSSNDSLQAPKVIRRTRKGL